MSSTKWEPHNQRRGEPTSWLLTDGRIVNEPDMEITSGHRRVRVRGIPSISADRGWQDSGVDACASKWVAQQTRRLKAKPWVPLRGMDGVAKEFDALGGPERLHFLDDSGRHTTQLWWRFRHPEYPIEAVLQVYVQPKDGRGTAIGEHLVSARFTHPDTTPSSFYNTIVVAERKPHFEMLVDKHKEGHMPTLDGLRTLVETTRSDWSRHLCESDIYPGRRQTAEALLKKVRAFDDLDSVEIPDLRDEQKPTWMTLELVDTNVGQSFVQDLLDFLEDGDGVAQALVHYEAWRKAMKNIGVVVGALSEDGLLAALQHSRESALTVPVVGPLDDTERIYRNDPYHKLSLHLASGTFVVECSKTVGADVTAAWTDALVSARLQGKEDDLRAWVAANQHTAHRRRTKKALDHRHALEFTL